MASPGVPVACVQVECYPSETENLLKDQKDQRVVVKLNIHIGKSNSDPDPCVFLNSDPT